MYNPIIDDSERCYGCGACVAVCPKKCIKIEKDDLGFNTVVMDDIKECISCGQCSKVCQINKIKKNEERTPNYIRRYYAQNKEKEVLKQSSSGGIFSALAKLVIEQKGFVWGVAMNESGDVGFQFVDNISSLDKLKGSKYVEVNQVLPFKDVEAQVKEGRLVLFTGTPCQIRALKSYMGEKKYDNLILVDLLCYGIQSPVMWKRYLSEVNPSGKDIRKVSMRYKGTWENYSMKIEFKDGTAYKKSRWKDPYLLTYTSNLYNRNSCMKCEAKSFPRSSDITIGDFWQIDKMNEIPREFNISQGVSVIITNTDKGEQMINSISDYLYKQEIPENIFTNMEEQYSKCCKPNNSRESFINNVEKYGFCNSAQKNKKTNLKKRVRFIYLRIKRLKKRK